MKWLTDWLGWILKMVIGFCIVFLIVLLVKYFKG